MANVIETEYFKREILCKYTKKNLKQRKRKNYGKFFF